MDVGYYRGEGFRKLPAFRRRKLAILFAKHVLPFWEDATSPTLRDRYETPRHILSLASAYLKYQTKITFKEMEDFARDLNIKINAYGWGGRVGSSRAQAALTAVYAGSDDSYGPSTVFGALESGALAAWLHAMETGKDPTKARNAEEEWQAEQILSEIIEQIYGDKEAGRYFDDIFAELKRKAKTKEDIKRATEKAIEDAHNISKIMESESFETWPIFVGLGIVAGAGAALLIGPEILFAAALAEGADIAAAGIVAIADTTGVATVSVYAASVEAVKVASENPEAVDFLKELATKLSAEKIQVVVEQAVEIFVHAQ